MDRASTKIKKDVLELAYQCIDYQYISDDEYGVIDDFKENNVEPTEELLEAIKTLNDDYCEEQNLEQRVKLSEYELQKKYFEIIKELVKEEHLPDMTIPI